MGIVIRQSLQSTVVAYLGVILGAINVMWLFPRYLEPNEFGVTRLIQDVGISFAVFAQIGTSSLSDRFFPLFKNDQKSHNGFVIMLLLYPLIGFALFSGVLSLFKQQWLDNWQEKAPTINLFFAYLFPITLFIVYQGILDSYIRTHLKTVVSLFIREVLLRIATMILIVLYANELINFYQFVQLLVATYGLLVVLLFIYASTITSFSPSAGFSFPDRPLIKQLLTYAFFVILGGSAGIVVSRVDSLMIGSMVGEASLAIFTVAAFMGTVIEIPKRTITAISLPLITQAWYDQDMHKIDELYQKTAINQLIIGALLFLGIWSNIDALFNLIPNADVYRDGKYVVLFMGLGRLIDMGTGVNNEIISQSKYYRFNFVAVGFLVILIVTTNLLFIPRYGIAGAAFATALSMLLANVLKFLFLWIKLGLQPFSLQTVAAVFITLCTFFTCKLIPASGPTPWESLTNIVVRSSVIIVMYCGLTFAFRISPEANSLVETTYRRFLQLTRSK